MFSYCYYCDSTIVTVALHGPLKCLVARTVLVFARRNYLKTCVEAVVYVSLTVMKLVAINADCNM